MKYFQNYNICNLRNLDHKGFTCKRFDKWTHQLDESINCLPEDEDYPHTLIKFLATHQTGRKKTTWLISNDGQPVAVTALKKANLFTWQPVTHYILPGIIAPAVNDELFSALKALNLSLDIALWRTNCGFPHGNSVRLLKKITTFGMPFCDDFETYWKHSSTWRNLRKATNKWKHLVLKVNTPGIAAWIIHNWGKKWGVAIDEIQDRIATSHYLEKSGKHFSLTLFDGDQPVAGQTCLMHRGTVVGQCFHRESNDNSLGNRLIQMTFYWAREKGFRAIDIGGGHDYKRSFAPPMGERYELKLAPLPVYLAERTVGKLRHSAGAVRRLITHAPPYDTQFSGRTESNSV
jgi:hypothetical protein